MTVIEPAERQAQASGWAGWAAFAGVMMLLSGSLQAITGCVALFKETYFYVGSTDLVVEADYAAWGWAHLLTGLFIAFAGAAVLKGATWGRVVGITIAFVSAIVNLAFVPAYPVWAITAVAINVLVIFALAVHGRELGPR